MERLVDLYGESGGEFLFDAHYLIGQAEKERDYQAAATSFRDALTNSSWHENANDARMRRGNSLIKVGEAIKDEGVFEEASTSFERLGGFGQHP